MIALPPEFRPEWGRSTCIESLSHALFPSWQHLINSAEEHLLPQIMNFLHSLPEPSQKEKNFLLEKRVWNATWTEQFCLLMSRGFKEQRHEVWSGLRVGQILALSFIVGCLWYKSDLKTFTRATDQVQ